MHILWDPVYCRDQIHKSHNTPVPYPTMHHSEQKCAHFCSEWCIVGYGTGALWYCKIGLIYNTDVLHVIVKESNNCKISRCISTKQLSI